MSVFRFIGGCLLMAAHGTVSAGFSGFWADDCDTGKEAIAIQRNHDEGPYQLIFCTGFKCIPLPGKREPTPIVGDSDFSDVTEDSLTLKGRTYQRCISTPEPHFDPVSEDAVRLHLLGSWNLSLLMDGNQQRRASNTSYRNTRLVIERGELSSFKKDVKEWSRNYKVEKDVLSIMNNGRTLTSYKILKINGQSLLLSEIERPSEAIRVYERVIDD